MSFIALIAFILALDCWLKNHNEEAARQARQIGKRMKKRIVKETH